MERLPGELWIPILVCLGDAGEYLTLALTCRTVYLSLRACGLLGRVFRKVVPAEKNYPMHPLWARRGYFLELNVDEVRYHMLRGRQVTQLLKECFECVGHTDAMQWIEHDHHRLYPPSPSYNHHHYNNRHRNIATSSMILRRMTPFDVFLVRAVESTLRSPLCQLNHLMIRSLPRLVCNGRPSWVSSFHFLRRAIQERCPPRFHITGSRFYELFPTIYDEEEEEEILADYLRMYNERIDSGEFVAPDSAVLLMQRTNVFNSSFTRVGLALRLSSTVSETLQELLIDSYAFNHSDEQGEDVSGLAHVIRRSRVLGTICLRRIEFSHGNDLVHIVQALVANPSVIHSISMDRVTCLSPPLVDPVALLLSNPPSSLLEITQMDQWEHLENPFLLCATPETPFRQLTYRSMFLSVDHLAPFLVSSCQASTMSSSLIALDLSDNSINHHASPLLGTFLSCCPYLKRLSLCNNLLTHTGMEEMAAGINQSKTLEFLDLSGNYIGLCGLLALLRGMDTNSSLAVLRCDRNTIRVHLQNDLVHILRNLPGIHSLTLRDNIILDEDNTGGLSLPVLVLS